MTTKRSDSISLKASADCSTKQDHFAIISGNETCTFAGTAGAGCIGVFNNKPKAGEAAGIDIGPIVFIKLSATLAANAVVSTTNTGTAKAAVATEHRLGRLLKGGNANDVVPMYFNPDGVQA